MNKNKTIKEEKQDKTLTKKSSERKTQREEEGEEIKRWDLRGKRGERDMKETEE